ncbi:type II toxin-antitoxin system ParD family antitoxin [Actibacterium ureilyticum]|uniref:type II toxin-antitoxin system ParD family antitoxin n=1 Tax=Actibacterium ureilyticum TaxID=1590614 RepID=UPI000BAACF70|nr:type II toxin-antitoxin system ParD family antitoxin [Actibacterium ureilyticum]
MATMNVSLPEQMKTWVEAQTKDGRYSNTSDYVRDLIRRDQDRRTAIAEIQAMVDEGLASGTASPFDMDAFLTRKREEHDSGTR